MDSSIYWKILDTKTKLIFASSSSVYGKTNQKSFSESQKTSKPLQLYAATKTSNELMAYAYHSLYNLCTIGLRFFTVYGTFGRPDMAMYKFSKKISQNKKSNYLIKETIVEISHTSQM